MSCTIERLSVKVLYNVAITIKYILKKGDRLENLS